jgi:hypothetical protein
MPTSRTRGPLQIYGLLIEEINDQFRRILEEFDRLSQQSLFRVVYLLSHVAIVSTVPGTSYAEVAAGLRQQLDFARQEVAQARLVVRGWGTGTGDQKGVAVGDADGKTIAEVTWNGSGEDTYVGSWTTVAQTTDTLTRLYAKGASATEALNLISVVLECRATVQR